MKRFICFILLLSMIFSLASCRDKVDYTASGREISGMYLDTSSYVYTYNDEDDTNVEKWAKICEDILSYYHKIFNIYYEFADVNNIKTINKNAGVSPVKVDKELVDFLVYCKELYALTQGKTNVMLGSVLKMWHNAREEADSGIGYLEPEKLPSAEELSSKSEHTSIDLLIIDEAASTVYISDPEASLDVGSVAKGYVVDILYKRLKAEGADSVVLNIGGNVRTIGLMPGGKKWKTGITNPDRSSIETIKCRIEIGEETIVTSGDYERYFVSGSKKYHHIIDPDTLMPADYFTSVSIITQSSALADALSTALFCMSYEDGLALIESIGGIEVIWIDKEYNIIHTSGIELLD